MAKDSLLILDTMQWVPSLLTLNNIKRQMRFPLVHTHPSTLSATALWLGLSKTPEAQEP
jgi:hypothetical protein